MRSSKSRPLALSRRKPEAVMDPSGNAIFAAKSKRSGADGSIASAIGGLTLRFAIGNSSVLNSGQSHAPTNWSSGSLDMRKLPFILTALPELEMKLGDRSLSQIFVRKGDAVLGTPKQKQFSLVEASRNRQQESRSSKSAGLAAT
jgi:hypothetical protein